jgi:hypothetical protein
LSIQANKSADLDRDPAWVGDKGDNREEAAANIQNKPDIEYVSN